MGLQFSVRSSWLRFGAGFLLGLILMGQALLLTGAGHGTYAPVVANASLVVLIPAFGYLLALFAPPLQWALYFSLVPAITSRIVRAVLLIVVLAHLIPGIVLAAQDSAFTRALGSQPGVVVAYGLTLALTCIVLALLCARQTKPYVGPIIK